MTTIQFSPNGELLASGNYDGTIRLWDVKDQTLIGVLKDSIVGANGSMAFSPDSKVLASSGGRESKSIMLWDLQQDATQKKVLQGHTDMVNTVAFSPDGKTIAAGSINGTVILWNRKTGQQKETMLRSHEKDQIVTLAFGPDSKRLVTGSRGLTSAIQLWDLESGKTVGEPRENHKIKKRPSGVYSINFDPSGERLATGGWDSKLRLWKVGSQLKYIETLSGHQGSVLSVAFSPDGSKLASGGGMGKINIWDADTKALLSERINTDQSAINGLAFSLDGKRLLSVNSEGTIINWGLHNSKKIQSISSVAETDLIAVAFSSDRQLLASLSLDGSIWLWNLGTMKRRDYPIRTGSSHQFVSPLAVNGLAFSPDDKQLLSVGFGHDVLLWDVDPDSWKDRACSRANRNLTQQEWDKFFGDETPYHRTCQALY